MNPATLIQSVRYVRPGEGTFSGDLLVRNGRIDQIGEKLSAPQDARRISGAGRLLTPGLIDLHTHGIGQNLYERGVEEYEQIARLLPRFGTTCVLPTLYRVMNRKSLKLLDQLTGAMGRVRDICMPGFHLEGPFLALPGAGAETIPGDVSLLEDVLAACHGRVLAMSISPDTPNIIPVIEVLVARRIAPLITHTRASVEQTMAAIEAGARHATHFYDVFPIPEEIEPGARPCGTVEAILADKRVTVDFIADGVHVPPVAIKAALAAKGSGGIVLITDSNIGAGLPPGEYDTTWGFRVRVAAHDAVRIATRGHPAYNCLAGSALTMDEGMRNLLRWLDLPPHEIWSMGTANPARVVGLGSKGRIEVGADADLVLWDDTIHPAITFVGGQIVYDAAKGGDA